MFKAKGRVLFVAMAALAVVSFGTSQAEAFWDHYRPWGYSTCYTPCSTTVACDPCRETSCGWYLGYRPGPIRRALFGPYRWYYGGSARGWSTCTNTCYTGTSFTWTSESSQPAPDVHQTPTPAAPLEEPVGVLPTEPPTAPETAPPMPPTTTPLIDLTPATPPPSEPPMTRPSGETEFDLTIPPGNMPGSHHMPGAHQEPALPDSSAVPTRDNSGMLVIYVPYAAKVTINGLETKAKGSRREYVSFDLKPGFTYKYEIVAEVIRDGYRVEESRTVLLTAGDRTSVAFEFNPRAAEGLVSR